VELYFQGSNGKPRQATIDTLYPAVDQVTRQTRFRVVVENTDHALRPGQYARITIKTDESRAPAGLIIPREALLDSGDTQRVFVSEGGGRFAPREVTVLAENHQGEVLIGEGLVAGEQVVVSGQFLLDSESRLREALLKMIAPEEPEEPEPAETEAMDGERARLWRDFYQAYLPLAKAMAADDSAHLGHQVEALTSATQRLVDKEPEAKPLAEMITRFRDAKKLDELRPHFRKFNDRLKPLALERGVPAAVEDTLVFLRCPMYPEMGDNAWWVQIDGPAANPYYGASMLRCFDEKMILPRAAKEEAHRHD
jgi:Cu(I)/Ag(I) efflux system membrane fusion protein